MFTSGRSYRDGFMRRRARRVPRYGTGLRGGRARASRGRGHYYFDTQTSAESKNFIPSGFPGGRPGEYPGNNQCKYLLLLVD
ncbi:hypothetical protein DPMN_193109 [Dreissena polymorpha]|uniref:Uncharacterized protein n=1 Tax=Dreissena polymorpha TaxID=45954 RepID=A0A9D3Y2L5_DREPO|nr:hypothetical protein DPMN_193109 [Dreissena polymorpha]